MRPSGLIHAYTRELLQFEWPGAQPVRAAPGPDPEHRKRNLDKALRAARAGGKPRLLLLGLGSGVLALDLARELGPDVELLAVDTAPARNRPLLARLAPELDRAGAGLATDSSIWSLLLLLDLSGVTPDNAVPLLNPESRDQEEKEACRALSRLFTASSRVALPPPPATPAKISAAAILRPGEPRLEEFLAQFPAWLHELCLVWDADRVPTDLPDAAVPTRQAARPLGLDFAAQRNAMLGLCRGDWVLYLDADERLDPATWAALPALAAVQGPGGWLLPRQTLYPDAEHCKIGFGLWPDLQLRLFRNTRGVRFENPVHEVLRGLDGPLGVARDLNIRHLSRLLKTREEIEAKLALFAKAGGAPHRLNQDYPRLPLELFRSGDSGPGALVLPRNLP